MLENIKNLITFKSIDKDVNENNFEIALEKLNSLIKEGFRPTETFLKRGRLCHKLLMLEEAYSDFTYIITHCAKKNLAYKERVKLNLEMGQYKQALADANTILRFDPNNFEIKKIKFLSYLFSSEINLAKEYILKLFENNKYKTIQFLLQEVAMCLTKDELGKGLKILSVIDTIDQDNPIKLLKEANIYDIAGEENKRNSLLKQIDTAFPKYFTTHFRFKDMYQPKDLLEICFLLELKMFDKQNRFSYPMKILEGYKKHIEGHILESKECFEKAIQLNPEMPEGYVLLAQTLQLMSGYDKPEYMAGAEENYKKAMEIYQKNNIIEKAEDMKRQLKHISSRNYIYK